MDEQVQSITNTEGKTNTTPQQRHPLSSTPLPTKGTKQTRPSRAAAARCTADSRATIILVLHNLGHCPINGTRHLVKKAENETIRSVR